MPNYTPGPWKVVGNHIVRDDATAREMAVDGIAQSGHWIGGACTPIGGHPVERANLALLAAAPDLLEALQAITDGFIDGSIKWAKPRRASTDPYHKANVLMCAAIAKAEGRES